MEITKSVLATISSIIVALGTTMATLLFQQNNKLIEVTVELRNIKEAVAKGTNNRYTSLDAERDFQVYNLKLNNLDKRVTNLEEKAK